MDPTPEADLELNPFWGGLLTPAESEESPFDFHRSLPDYRPTPLLDCPQLAETAGVGAVLVKNEALRFGQNSFKALGPSYALPRLLSGESTTGATVAAASEGNHGRALAWAAKQAGCAAVIYMGHEVAEWRRRAIRDLGARVHIVDGNYDSAVRQAAIDAAANGWIHVPDTASGGDAEAPRHIVRGYTTLFYEAWQQLRAADMPPSHLVMLQAGVGGLAAAGVQAAAGEGQAPLLVTVEPLAAACLLASIRTSQGQTAPELSTGPTSMSCLRCGQVSESAWGWLRAGINAFVAIADEWAGQARRLLEEAGIASEPSGAAGLGGLLALMRHPELARTRDLLQLDSRTRVLVINTEGAGDRGRPTAVKEAHEVA